MASPEMLKWQYKVVIAELQHLQLHASDPTCPCTLSDSGEYCLPKHALMVASLATETASMDAGNGDMFRQLADEANSVHETLRLHVCGYGEDIPVVSWSRDWRKKVEGLYYACQVTPAAMEQAKITPPEKQPRWCFPQLGQAFDYVEMPKRELPPPPVKATGEQLRLFMKTQRKEHHGAGKTTKEKKGEEEKIEMNSGNLLAEIASKICGDGTCFARPRGDDRKCKLVGDYYHCKIKPKGHFDHRSFRTVTPKEGVRVTIGCKKNKWDPKAERCKIGTEAQKIMYHRDAYEGGS